MNYTEEDFQLGKLLYKGLTSCYPEGSKFRSWEELEDYEIKG